MSRFVLGCICLFVIAITALADDPLPRFQMPTDFKIKDKFLAVEDLIQIEDWSKVLEILQGLLDAPENRFVEVTRQSGVDGKKVNLVVSGWTEAEKRLGELPMTVREKYEFTFGNQARALLTKAKKDQDAVLLAETARRYYWTEAGPEALEALAQHHPGERAFRTGRPCLSETSSEENHRQGQ